MSGLILDNVSKTYDNGFHAVKNISFQTNNDDFLVLVGPSGCGKSTVLRMIAGLEEISEGEIILNGKRLNDLSPKQRNVGMVFQNYALYPHLSVYDNIAFPLAIAKEKKSEIVRRVHETAELVDLTEFLQSKPRELSGGQRQRTALARAIIRKPDIFLFDEPLSNLDANLRLQMRTEIKKLHERSGIISVYVTHDQVEAMTMGTQIVILKDGCMRQINNPEVIYAKPADVFTAKFVGNPVINIFPAKYENNKIVCEDNEKKSIFAIDALKQSGFLNGSLLNVGIRPENISFEATSNNSSFFDVQITNKEYLGHEVIYYFILNNRSYAIRTTNHQEVARGSVCRLFFDPERVNVFDEKEKIIY